MHICVAEDAALAADVHLGEGVHFDQSKAIMI